jgi:hypothetical protein
VRGGIYLASFAQKSVAFFARRQRAGLLS